MANFQIHDGVTVDYTADGWDEFKKWIDGTYAYLAYTWVDEGQAYAIVAIDGKVYRTFSINKTDAADFETTYKVNAPTVLRNMDGSPVVAERLLGLRKRVFADPTSGAESMTVDGSASSVDEEVWNGEGSYWADPSIGSKTTGSKRTGTYGWDTAATSQNNEVRFTRSTPFQPSSDRIEGWINLQALPAGVAIQARWELSNSAKGNGVIIQDYLPSQDLGVWQFWSIDIADFNLPAEDVDEFRFRTLFDDGADYWLDDVRLVSGNASKVFRMAAVGVGEWLVDSVTLMLVADDTGWGSDAFCNIAGGLANGLQLRHRDLAGGSNFWKVVTTKNVELFGQFDPVVDTAYSDNTRQISFVLRPGAASVIVTANDVLEFLIKDDLTSLVNVRAFAHVGVIVENT